MTWRRVVAWVFGALSAFVLAYVVFVHAQAASHRMSPDARDFAIALGVEGRLPAGYDVRSQGALGYAFPDGKLVVSGPAHAGDALVFSSSVRRFDDGVLTLRFRIADGAEGAGAFVGLEQPGTGRTVAATFVSGKEPFVVMGGDLSGPMRTTSGDLRSTIETKPGEWHTLALQFTPAFAMMSVAFDGHPISSLPVQWFQGTSARIVFGVTARAEVARADVTLDSIALQTLDWAVPRSFDDRFAGAIIDNTRWFFNEPDPAVASLDARTEPGRGLALGAAVHGFSSDPAFGYILRTFPFVLRTVRIHVELSIDELTNATLFVGLMGASEWIPQGRVFDTGIVRRGDDTFLFTAGAWTNDAKLTFERATNTAVPRDLSFDLEYDADRLVGRVREGSAPFVEHPIDLKPLDLVSFRIGMLGHAPDAKSRVHVRRIALDVR